VKETAVMKCGLTRSLACMQINNSLALTVPSTCTARHRG